MYPIGEASRQSGVAIETIRYYERSALLPKPARTTSGRRVYDTDSIARLRFVRRCRALGFPLAQVKQMLGLIAGDIVDCSAIRDIANTNLGAVQSRIHELTEMAVTLTLMIEDCNAGNNSCPMAKRLLETN